jgi:hypothetical protein
VTFIADQRSVLKKASDLPPHIATMMDTFHEALSAEEQGDPRFAYRVAFIRKTGNRASSADLAVEFVKPDSAEGREINSVLLKEVDKSRYTAKQIVKLMMQDEGFALPSAHSHEALAGTGRQESDQGIRKARRLFEHMYLV